MSDKNARQRGRWSSACSGIMYTANVPGAQRAICSQTMSGDEDYGRAVDFLSTLAVNP
jgi:hypothetical protein